MDLLRLRPIIIRQDVPYGSLLRRANQDAALAGVSYKDVELSLVGHQPSSQSFAVGLAALVILSMVMQP